MRIFHDEADFDTLGILTFLVLLCVHFLLECLLRLLSFVYLEYRYLESTGVFLVY